MKQLLLGVSVLVLGLWMAPRDALAGDPGDFGSWHSSAPISSVPRDPQADPHIDRIQQKLALFKKSLAMDEQELKKYERAGDTDSVKMSEIRNHINFLKKSIQGDEAYLDQHSSRKVLKTFLENLIKHERNISKKITPEGKRILELGTEQKEIEGLLKEALEKKNEKQESALRKKLKQVGEQFANEDLQLEFLKERRALADQAIRGVKEAIEYSGPDEEKDFKKPLQDYKKALEGYTQQLVNQKQVLEQERKKLEMEILVLSDATASRVTKNLSQDPKTERELEEKRSEAAILEKKIEKMKKSIADVDVDLRDIENRL